MVIKSFRKSVKSIGVLLSAGALVMGVGISAPVQASEPYIGQIETFGFNFPPRGWSFCDGQLLSIASNTALFSLLGTTFGGNGRTDFALPDLRGRVAKHVGNGAGLNPVSWGQRGGTETRTLTVAQMPSHSHTATLRGTNEEGDSQFPGMAALAVKPRADIYRINVPDAQMIPMRAGSVVLQNNGGGQAFDIRNPYLGIYHSIALVGIFPSRN